MDEDLVQARLPVRSPIARGTIDITAYVTIFTEDDVPSCTATDSPTTCLVTPITIGTGPFMTYKDIVIIIHRRSEINQPLGAVAHRRLLTRLFKTTGYDVDVTRK